MSDNSFEYLLEGADGIPIGVADLMPIVAAGTQYAIDMAKLTNNPAGRAKLAVDYTERFGAVGFGLIAGTACSVLAASILDPLVTICEAAGISAKEAIAEMAIQDSDTREPDNG